MRGSTKWVCWVLIAMTLATSCGRREPAVREKTFLTLEEPVKTPNLLHGAVVRGAGDDWFVAAFTDKRFMSATEPEEAIAVFESKAGAALQPVAKISSSIAYGVWGYDMAVDADGGLCVTWVCSMYKAVSPQPHARDWTCLANSGSTTRG